LQARRFSQAGDLPGRQRQAASASRRSAYRRDRGGRGAAAGKSPCGRPQRHRGDCGLVAAICRAACRRDAEVLMAQLSDDCFAFSGPLLRLDDMEQLIAQRVTPVAETERVPLMQARGRISASDIVAPINLPPFDNSAVDGYAVRHADLKAEGDTPLAVAGRLTAGAR